MFARVITAQAGAEGFDGAIRVAEQQLPGARQMPGFKGYYLLTDAETGKLVIISLWETREQMEAVTAGQGRPASATSTFQRRDSRHCTWKPTKSRCTPKPQAFSAASGCVCPIGDAAKPFDPACPSSKPQAANGCRSASSTRLRCWPAGRYR